VIVRSAAGDAGDFVADLDRRGEFLAPPHGAAGGVFDLD